MLFTRSGVLAGVNILYFTLFVSSAVVHGAMGFGQEKLYASAVVSLAPVRVPNQRPLAQSVTSVANDKGDNEMIPEAVYRSPGICLAAEGNRGKLQLGDRLMKRL